MQQVTVSARDSGCSWEGEVEQNRRDIGAEYCRVCMYLNNNGLPIILQ